MMCVVLGQNNFGVAYFWKFMGIIGLCLEFLEQSIMFLSTPLVRLLRQSIG